MELHEDECQRCFEPVLVMGLRVEKGVRLLYLQPDEVEVIDEDGKAHRGHERHWKYCVARPQTGSVSAAPPEEHEDVEP